MHPFFNAIKQFNESETAWFKVILSISTAEVVLLASVVPDTSLPLSERLSFLVCSGLVALSILCSVIVLSRPLILSRFNILFQQGLSRMPSGELKIQTANKGKKTENFRLKMKILDASASVAKISFFASFAALAVYGWLRIT